MHHSFLYEHNKTIFPIASLAYGWIGSERILSDVSNLSSKYSRFRLSIRKDAATLYPTYVSPFSSKERDRYWNGSVLVGIGSSFPLCLFYYYYYRWNGGLGRGSRRITDLILILCWESRCSGFLASSRKSNESNIVRNLISCFIYYDGYIGEC